MHNNLLRHSTLANKFLIKHWRFSSSPLRSFALDKQIYTVEGHFQYYVVCFIEKIYVRFCFLGHTVSIG